MLRLFVLGTEQVRKHVVQTRQRVGPHTPGLELPFETSFFHLFNIALLRSTRDLAMACEL